MKTGVKIIILAFFYCSFKLVYGQDYGSNNIDTSSNYQDKSFSTDVKISDENVHNGKLNFGHAIFERKACLVNDTFSAYVGFYSAHFKQKAKLFIKFLYEGVDLSHSVFDAAADFSGSQFSTVDYSPDEVLTKPSTDFHGSKFHEVTCFTNCTFSRSINFENSVFYNRVLFDSILLYGTLNFSNATFSSYADFSSLDLRGYGNIVFSETHLPKLMNFSNNTSNNIQLPLTIDLTAARLDDGLIYLYLYKTDVSHFRFDYTHFRLCFEDPKTCKELSFDDKVSIYEQVLNNFKDKGQKESIKRLDIEYQDFLKHSWGHLCPQPFKEIGSIIGCFLSIISKYWWNYGYNKEYIFIWTIFFFAVFTFLVYRKLEFLQRKVYEIDPITLPPRHNRWNKIWQSVIYTSIVFFGITIKLNKVKQTGKYFMLILSIYFIGLINVFFIVNYILKQ